MLEDHPIIICVCLTALIVVALLVIDNMYANKLIAEAHQALVK